jgi:hypothetical protein
MAEVLTIQIRHLNIDDWETVGRLAVYRTGNGDYSQLPERPSQLRMGEVEIKKKEEDEKAFHFVPGQFCELSLFGKGEAPFGIASSPTENGSLKFTINKAGVVTTALHHLEEGTEIGIRGPLGNGYPIDLFQGKNVLVIGGGFAFTTLRSLIAFFLHPENRNKVKDITVIYGARMPGLLLYKEELAELPFRPGLRGQAPFGWVIWCTHGWSGGASAVMDTGWSPQLNDDYPSAPTTVPAPTPTRRTPTTSPTPCSRTAGSTAWAGRG